MRLFSVTACTVVLVACTSSGQAGILSDLLTYAGDDVVIEDNSRGLISDQQDPNEPGHGVLSAGDVLYGLIRIDRRISPTPTASMDDSMQLVVAYSYEVDTVDELDSLGMFTVDYRPTSVATGLDLKSLLGATHEPVGFTDWDRATFVVMEQTFASDDVANNPVSNTLTDGDLLIDSVLADGSGYTLDLIAGFGSDDDFYQSLMIGAPGITIADILAADGSVTLGTHSGGYTALYDNLESGAVFLPVEATAVIGAVTTSHDIGLEGGVLLGNNQQNWDFADKANFRLNVVPEPSALTLCGLLVGLLGLCRWRKSFD